MAVYYWWGHMATLSWLTLVWGFLSTAYGWVEGSHWSPPLQHQMDIILGDLWDNLGYEGKLLEYLWDVTHLLQTVTLTDITQLNGKNLCTGINMLQNYPWSTYRVWPRAT